MTQYREILRLNSLENQFDPTKNISYKRGDVVEVNFGFNVGTEYGGLHFAIVLDKANNHRAGSITVVPLTSSDNKMPYERDVFLGSELHNRLNAQNTALIQKANNELRELEILKESILNISEPLKKFLEEQKDPMATTSIPPELVENKDMVVI